MANSRSKRSAQTAKQAQLGAHTLELQDSVLSSQQGLEIRDNQNSLRAGERGPTLLEDFLLREKIMHFDHERIPERVVHARGAAAHGYFQVYESLAEYTMAEFLCDPALKTPVFVRFSTVAGSRGSADTVRDVRGFATKFYTRQGNYDLVGNNMPVFFIQDAIKFPDFVHAVKAEPHNEIPQAQSAHDTFWDFVSLTPEIMHMLMWVMSDRALPRSYRMMEGFGVHTFRLVNAQGISRFVKFHWKPLLGTHSLAWDEVLKIAGKDPDFNRRDLWETLEAGVPAEWELGLQIVEEADVDTLDFDLLDPTKIIPEEIIPVRRVGKLTLDRNPDNFFAETEQVAFLPTNLVPGIDFSNDPLLQGRLFSYLDTQLSRLGGPNFAQIPINRPIAPVRNNQRDGFHQHDIHPGRTAYEPNSLSGGCPMQSRNPEAFRTYAEHMNGAKARVRSASFADHFSQATLFFRSQSPAEQRHLIAAIRFELSKVSTPHIRERVIRLLANVDETLATAVAEPFGIEVSDDLSYLRESTTSSLPNDRRGAAKPGVSPSLSLDHQPRDSIATRKIAFVLAPGFDGKTTAALKKTLEAAGAIVAVVAPKVGEIHGDDGSTLIAEFALFSSDSVLFDAVFVPGGAGVPALANSLQAREFVLNAYRHCKALALSREAVSLLDAAGITTLLAAAGVTPGEDAALLLDAKGSATAIAEGFVPAVAHHRNWKREEWFSSVD